MIRLDSLGKFVGFRSEPKFGAEPGLQRKVHAAVTALAKLDAKLLNLHGADILTRAEQASGEAAAVRIALAAATAAMTTAADHAAAQERRLHTPPPAKDAAEAIMDSDLRNAVSLTGITDTAVWNGVAEPGGEYAPVLLAWARFPAPTADATAARDLYADMQRKLHPDTVKAIDETREAVEWAGSVLRSVRDVLSESADVLGSDLVLELADVPALAA